MTLLAERFSRAVEIEPTVERSGGRRREARLSTKSAEIKPRRAVGGSGREDGLSAKDFERVGRQCCGRTSVQRRPPRPPGRAVVFS